MPPDEYLHMDADPTRQLVSATLEAGQRRLTDAAAQLQEYERLAARATSASVAAAAAGGAAAADEAAAAELAACTALARLRGLLSDPVLPFEDPRIALLASEHRVADPAANATRLGDLASAVEAAAAKRGPPYRRRRPTLVLRCGSVATSKCVRSQVGATSGGAQGGAAVE